MNSKTLAEILPICFLWILIVTAIVHFVFAAGVYFSADGLRRHRRRVQLVPTVIWLLATLVGGVFAATMFWMIHHSNLSPEVTRVLPAASDRE